MSETPIPASHTESDDLGWTKAWFDCLVCGKKDEMVLDVLMHEGTSIAIRNATGECSGCGVKFRSAQQGH